MNTIRAMAMACLLICTAAVAQSQQVSQFNIPAQPLGDALRAVGKVTNVNVLYDPPMVARYQAPAVSGALTTDQALRQLLAGTALSFRFVNEHTVVLMVADRIASNDEQSSSMQKVAEAPQAETSGASASAKEKPVNEVVVTGTNIRGVYPASSPVEIYTAEDILQTGAVTTEQFISRLPQNLATWSQYMAGGAISRENRESVNTVDLRGLGVGTTLVLLNGRRLGMTSNGQAVDTSLIPVSAIERVEVLTDGASAIYGSDAIGGVVNFVLREKFDGAETRVGYGGTTDGGLRQENFTQTLGGSWTSGRGLISFDYLNADPLETMDRDYAAPAGPGYLTPDDRRYSALATASQRLTDRVDLNADFAFSRRDTRNQFSVINPFYASFSTRETETEQFFGNLGAQMSFGESLTASLLSSYSRVDVSGDGATAIPAFNYFVNSTIETQYKALDLTAMLGGPLFALSSGQVRFSAGGGYLDERYTSSNLAFTSALSGKDLGRETVYLFGELFVPLADRLELSLAARYTDHRDSSSPPLGRDFGDKVSPKVGVMWAAAPSLKVRATYGRSFRAPFLSELDPSGSDSLLQQSVPVGGVNAPVLSIYGAAPDMQAETARSFTTGFDYQPAERAGLKLSMTYFNIDYDGRIAQPSQIPARENPAGWPDLIFRPSSAAQIENFLRTLPTFYNDTGIDLTNPQTAAAMLFNLPGLWISDLRSKNLALTKIDGVDVSADQAFETRWGQVTLGARLTRIFDFEEQVTPTAPVFSAVDTVLRPVSLRGRAQAGFTRGSFQSALNFNYVDDYTNPQTAGTQSVASWTTVDWQLSYKFARGIRTSLSVQNLFDRDPPLVQANSAVGLLGPSGFDPANANPLGRLATLGVAFDW